MDGSNGAKTDLLDCLDGRANELVVYAASAYPDTTRLGSFTPSLYSSAWVAMVRHQNQEKGPLAFPECFQYVLDEQQDHGGWDSGGLLFDDVMDTLAGLLSLVKNRDVASALLAEETVEFRIRQASGRLNEYLQAWDIKTCDHVAFEILMPTMIEMLESYGFTFEFPSKNELMFIRQTKTAKLEQISWWSGRVQTPITHSLEGFIDKVDFSGLWEQKIDGSVGNSPASTAAYLMSSKPWDCDAENHLRLILQSIDPAERGALPIAYPTTGFEVFWIVSTLLQNGFECSKLQRLDEVAKIVDEYYNALNGLTSGFSKYGVPDADDTSKSIVLRNKLGVPTLPDALLQRFSGSSCIRTYDLERTASVTTNCHAALAILSCPHPERYTADLSKLIGFLCDSWTMPGRPFKDKWNNSEFYPMMLCAEALTEFLHAADRLRFPARLNNLELNLPCMVATQILTKILQSRNPDGSWGPESSREITAYAIIALVSLSSIPFLLPHIKQETISAIVEGRKVLTSQEVGSKVEKHWIDKTSFSPRNVTKAYILAAEKAPDSKLVFGSFLIDTISLPMKHWHKTVNFYQTLPHLESCPGWLLDASVIESYFHCSRLQCFREDIFSRQGMAADQYLTFIALNIVCANNVQRLFVKSDMLFDLMVLILRIYHIDEFAEHIVAKAPNTTVLRVKNLIDDLFQTRSVPDVNGRRPVSYNGEMLHATKRTNGVLKSDTNGEMTVDDELLSYKTSLSLLIESILSNDLTKTATQYEQKTLSNELRVCLLAHMQQIVDSRERQDFATSDTPWYPNSVTFHGWLRTFGASHSCSLVMLAFEKCLMTRTTSVNASPTKLYVIQDLWTHMSNKGRLENDRASIRRDRKEKNLNSLDFVEFAHLDDEQALRAISELIEYEKRCCEQAFQELEKVEQASPLAADGALSDDQVLRFQYFLSDLYSDLYTIKDVSCEV